MASFATPTALVLENGTVFRGRSFGSATAASGEVVFNTAMVGYPESLTDPSYIGQILVITYPIVGSYGVLDNHIVNHLSNNYESEHIHVRGLVVSDYTHEHSHWRARKSLHEWLCEHRIPGLCGIDTRALTKMLRDRGTLLGKIIPGDGAADDSPFDNPDSENMVAKGSCREVITYAGGATKIVLVDCGIKHNIIRCLQRRGVTVIRVPWDYDFHTLAYDGLFISNGPGNPDYCGATVEHIRRALADTRPVFGICMGNQLLAKAGGAATYKMKYGHRSHNQPVRLVGTNRCFITSQNHGYAVDAATLGSDWEPLFVNMNDGTNEGIRHRTKPFFSAQFHPEATSGPTDTEFLFDDFLQKIHA
ncbi:MAG: glutamine-hydrolyzing carbamoyl-phosphate synthase small subunit [Prevotellaceae bacterium]|jgi:carbamoyl-phosphate synthase small subunit|nr:glutamine-hydrolyzing carbamoyl-phosphate synthase small subunit [Prevotellaceae bacterium]